MHIEFFIFLTQTLGKSLKYLKILKLLDLTLRLFMIQYGNRVVDVEWVIKLNKQGVSEKSIVKILKLIILGTVN